MWKPNGKRPLGRSRSRCEDNIKLELQDNGWGVWTGLINLSQHRDRWQAVVNDVMNLRVSQNAVDI